MTHIEVFQLLGIVKKIAAPQLIVRHTLTGEKVTCVHAVFLALTLDLLQQNAHQPNDQSNPRHYRHENLK